MMNKMREDFEAAFKEKLSMEGYGSEDVEFVMRRNAAGLYSTPRVESAWWAWRRATTAASDAIGGVLPDIYRRRVCEAMGTEFILKS